MTGIDDLGIRGQRQDSFEVDGGSGKGYPAADGYERTVGDDFETALLGAPPRRGACTGDELTAVAKNEQEAGV